MINLIGFGVEKSKQVFEPAQALKLSRADTILLMKTLDRPAVTNEKLKIAASRYEKKIKQ